MTHPQPELYIVVHSQWEAFTERRTEASYEAIDNWADKLGLDDTLDVVAGAWWSPRDKRIYVDEELAKAAFNGDADAKELLKHEKGHQERVLHHDHPTSPWPMFRHALKVGFDYRAGTRVLRFRKHRSPPGFRPWWQQQRNLWGQGLNQPKPAPEA